ncbi:InlB B-repeat-containing protein [Tenacibaculum sp. 190524A05c]|uniref:InlB B-repeat-containing protein n=1 Tax=Tenacibaculum platacis TaxID=3137852 RepID=UPI0032B2A416
MVKKILLLLVVFVITTSTAQVPTNGLLSYYKFSNGSFTNEVTNGVNLQTANLSVTNLIRDRFGVQMAALNSNSNNDGLKRANFSISNASTLSFWIKTSVNDANNRHIIDKSDKVFPNFSSATSPVAGFNSSGFSVVLRNGKIGLEYRFAKYHFATNIQFAKRENFANTIVSDSQWHHIAVTFNFSDLPNQIKRIVTKIYIDGVEEGVLSTDEFRYNPTSVYGIDKNVDAFLFRAEKNSFPSVYNYSSDFDDLAIFNRVLSLSEIQNIYTENNDCFVSNDVDFSITNFGNNSVNVNINDTGDFDIAYHKETDSFSTATIVSGVSSGVTTLQNLAKNVNYKIYVKQQVCSDPMLGWSSPKTTLLPGPFFVNVNATGNNTGSDWANAFNNIQNALDVAGANGEIWVAKGVYVPTTTSRSVSLEFRNSGLKVYGGFAGTETSLSDRDMSLIHTTNETIFSGDLNGDDNGTINFTETTRSENSYRVVNVTKDNIVIDGITISGGNANGSGNDRYGSALSVNTGVVNFTIRNSHFKDNTSVLGALYLRAQSNNMLNYTVDACIFENNLSSNVAAGIYVLPEANTTMNFTLTNSLFNNNRTANNGSALGHGLSTVWLRSFNSGNQIDATIVNNTFVNNRNEGTGNSDFATFGISQQNGTYGTVNIANNIFWGNTNNSGNTALAFGKRTDNSIASGLTVFNSIDEQGFSNISSGNLTNTSNSDPLFTNVTGGDFTLQSNSPAIDSGSNTKIPASISVDLLNNNRIHNTNVDIGAYEFGASPFIIQHTLTLNATNGTVSTNPNPTGGTYDNGTSVVLTATPASGYQFDGWSGDATGTTNPLTIVMNEDKTIAPMFSLIPVQYTLTINASNGTVSTNPNATGGTYDDGTSVELTATPASGYQFDGWSGDATGTTNPLTITMDADKTVTAMFSKIQRRLTINASNGTVSTNPNPTGGTYDDGTSVVLTAIPATSGYQFDGWSGDATGTTNPLTIVMDSDKTVTAMFSKIQRTLTINATNGSVSTNPNPLGGTYDDGTSVELTATPDAGYQFDGWSGNATGTTNPLTIVMDSDKTVTAMFSKIQRTLTINATNGSVSTNPNPVGGTYDDGTSVELTATPDAGYQFDGWSGNATGTTNPLTIVMDSDKTVTAMFSKIQRTLTLNATNGTVSTNPNPTGGTYDDGTSVQLTATPDAGYQFDGWSGDATGTTNPLTITMDADKTVTAIFSKIQRTLTINATNGTVNVTNPFALKEVGVNGGKVNTQTGQFDDGTTIRLTAVPDSGYQFDGWSGDATGTTNPIDIVMDSDKTVTAMFSAVTASVVDEEFNKGVKAYPIPVSNVLTVDVLNNYEIKRIVIYSILGKRIIETKESKIDVSNLVNGVYILKVTDSEGRVASRRIIKK